MTETESRHAHELAEQAARQAEHDAWCREQAAAARVRRAQEAVAGQQRAVTEETQRHRATRQAR